VYGCVSFGWEKIDREREKLSVKKYSGVFFSNNNNQRVLYALVYERGRESDDDVGI
jgi:hypothetical protein